MNKAWQNWFNRALSPLGQGADSLYEGCYECGGLESWPWHRTYYYALLVYAIYGLAYWTGAWPRITSGYRCAPCNRRRDGAPRSRHLAMTGGGKPYAAVDLQWRSGVIDRTIGAYLPYVPALVRRSTGWRYGVGVILYPGTRRIHLDLREQDYVSDRR